MMPSFRNWRTSAADKSANRPSTSSVSAPGSGDGGRRPCAESPEHGAQERPHPERHGEVVNPGRSHVKGAEMARGSRGEGRDPEKDSEIEHDGRSDGNLVHRASC